MARRLPTYVALLPVLAACSTTPNVAVENYPDGSIEYLRGVTTRYAVSIDELSSETRPKHTGLHGAVVAGDASMTAAASLYRCDGVYTLDLVLHNHGDRPLEIDRAQIRLYDADGVPLVPMFDWPQGIDHGLRAEQATVYAYDMVRSGSRSTGGGAVGVPGKGGTALGPVAVETPRTGDPTWTERDLRVVQQTVTLPAVLTVSPSHHAPYWAYWQARPAKTPLIATIRIGDKRMVMEFEEPTEALAR